MNPLGHRAPKTAKEPRYVSRSSAMTRRGKALRGGSAALSVVLLLGLFGSCSSKSKNDELQLPESTQSRSTLVPPSKLTAILPTRVVAPLEPGAFCLAFGEIRKAQRSYFVIPDGAAGDEYLAILRQNLDTLKATAVAGDAKLTDRFVELWMAHLLKLSADRTDRSGFPLMAPATLTDVKAFLNRAGLRCDFAKPSTDAPASGSGSTPSTSA